MRAFFSPVLINKLVGVVYYFQTSVYILHTIPNINAITLETAASYARAYSNSLLDDDQDDETSKIELPTLTKAKDWTPFKETFLQLLSIIHGAHKIPLTYVIDTTPRAILRSNAAQVEAETIDLEDEPVFIQKSVYFGNNFKHDNTMVWNKLKNALLDKPGYNHISQFNNSKPWL